MKDEDYLPRVSLNEIRVLEMLRDAGRELYGLEMVEGSEGRLKRGTIYVTLQRMEEKGFIESRLESRPAPEVGIPRRLYQLTGAGQRVLNAYDAAEQIFAMGVA